MKNHNQFSSDGGLCVPLSCNTVCLPLSPRVVVFTTLFAQILRVLWVEDLPRWPLHESLSSGTSSGGLRIEVVSPSPVCVSFFGVPHSWHSRLLSSDLWRARFLAQPHTGSGVLTKKVSDDYQILHRALAAGRSLP